MIEALDQWSIEQIKSSQVIVSLTAVVKELVENSLDAGATVINVRLTNYGLEKIVVQDNGSGIQKEDFPLLACKHATSKLRSHAALNEVSYLGFRGEALASICNVADLQIITNTGSSVGSLLTFDCQGKLESEKPVAAPRGTIATVSSLFSTLPVRLKTMQREQKKGLSDVTALLQSYAIIAPITLTLEHTTKDRTKRVILRSQGSSMRNRISSVFSPGLASQLVEIDYNNELVKVTGYVSSFDATSAGSGSGRQLIFINKRPSDQPAVNKCIKEFYRQSTQNGQPFFALNFELSPSTLDVNCSPDKRMVVLHDEPRILKELQHALESALCVNKISVPRESETRNPTKQTTLRLDQFKGTGALIHQSHRNSKSDFDLSVAGDSSSESESEQEPKYRATRAPQRVAAKPALPSSLGLESEQHISMNENNATSSTLSSQPGPKTAKKSTRVLARTQMDCPSDSNQLTGSFGQSGAAPSDSSQCLSPSIGHSEVPTSSIPQPHQGPGFQLASHLMTDSEPSAIAVAATPITALSPQVTENTGNHCQIAGNDTAGNAGIENCTDGAGLPANIPQATSEIVPHQTEHFLTSEELEEPHLLSTEPVKRRRALALGKAVTISVTLEEIEASRRNSSSVDLPTVKNLDIASDEAERRLSLVIKKDDFANMKIVGQFNKGFIIVTNETDDHGGTDIFVIDQHASDEIYNFEQLQLTTKFIPQHLVVPLELELSPVEELSLIDNLDIFKRNGFGFEIDPSAVPGKQCKLKSVPYYRNTLFNENDVYELIHKIQEDPSNRQVSCSKTRAMFAMRACRMSIMIGRFLDRQQMTKVVKNLGTLRKPWNCPHGRPTLRHITTLR